VRSDSFNRQNVQHFAGLPCKLELHACSFPPAYQSSTVHAVGISYECRASFTISFSAPLYYLFGIIGKM
jgi:hypothetical protein